MRTATATSGSCGLKSACGQHRRREHQDEIEHPPCEPVPSQVRVPNPPPVAVPEPRKNHPSLKHTLAVTTQDLTKTCRTRATSSVCQRTVAATVQRRCPRSRAKPSPQPRPLRFWRLHTGKVTQLLPQVGPNHSVKGSANGVPPGPGHRYALHFRWPGPGVTPSSPPYLKR